MYDDQGNMIFKQQFFRIIYGYAQDILKDIPGIYNLRAVQFGLKMLFPDYWEISVSHPLLRMKACVYSGYTLNTKITMLQKIFSRINTKENSFVLNKCIHAVLDGLGFRLLYLKLPIEVSQSDGKPRSVAPSNKRPNPPKGGKRPQKPRDGKAMGGERPKRDRKPKKDKEKKAPTLTESDHIKKVVSNENQNMEPPK